MFKKIVSTWLISSFILTMPGSQFYQAWGQGGQNGARVKSAAIDRAQAARLLQIPVLPGASIQKNLDFQRRFLKSAAALDSVQGQASAGKKASPPAGISALGNISGLSGEVSSSAKDPRAPLTEVKAKAGEAFETGTAGASSAPDAISGKRVSAKRSTLNTGRGAFRASLKPFPANRPLAAAWVRLSSRRGSATIGDLLKIAAVPLVAGLGYKASAMLGITPAQGILVSGIASSLLGFMLHDQFKIRYKLGRFTNASGSQKGYFRDARGGRDVSVPVKLRQLGGTTMDEIGKILLFSGLVSALGSASYLLWSGWKAAAAAGSAAAAVKLAMAAPLGMPGGHGEESAKKAQAFEAMVYLFMRAGEIQKTMTKDTQDAEGNFLPKDSVKPLQDALVEYKSYVAPDIKSEKAREEIVSFLENIVRGSSNLASAHANDSKAFVNAFVAFQGDIETMVKKEGSLARLVAAVKERADKTEPNTGLGERGGLLAGLALLALPISAGFVGVALGASVPLAFAAGAGTGAAAGLLMVASFKKPRGEYMLEKLPELLLLAKGISLALGISGLGYLLSHLNVHISLHAAAAGSAVSAQLAMAPLITRESPFYAWRARFHNWMVKGMMGPQLMMHTELARKLVEENRLWQRVRYSGMQTPLLDAVEYLAKIRDTDSIDRLRRLFDRRVYGESRSGPVTYTTPSMTVTAYPDDSLASVLQSETAEALLDLLPSKEAGAFAAETLGQAGHSGLSHWAARRLLRFALAREMRESAPALLRQALATKQGYRPSYERLYLHEDLAYAAYLLSTDPAAKQQALQLLVEEYNHPDADDSWRRPHSGIADILCQILAYDLAGDEAAKSGLLKQLDPERVKRDMESYRRSQEIWRRKKIVGWTVSQAELEQASKRSS